MGLGAGAEEHSVHLPEVLLHLQNILGGNLPDDLVGLGVDHLDHGLPAVLVHAERELALDRLGHLVEVFHHALKVLGIHGGRPFRLARLRRLRRSNRCDRRLALHLTNTACTPVRLGTHAPAYALRDISIHIITYFPGEESGGTPDSKPLSLLLEQRQYGLGQGIGLGDHGDTGLLQDLGPGQVGRFRREVGVLDAGTGTGEVLGGHAQI